METDSIRLHCFQLPVVVIVVVIMVIIVVMTKVDPDVKSVMIPIRFVILTPLPGRVHLGDVVLDLAALLAVATCIAIYSCAIRLKPPMTIILPIPVCASSTSEGQHESAGQCAGQNHPTPQSIARHDCLLEAVSGTRAAPLLMLPFVITRRHGEVSGQVCNLNLGFTDRLTRSKAVTSRFVIFFSRQAFRWQDVDDVGFSFGEFRVQLDHEAVAQFFHCERFTYRPGSRNPPSTVRVWPVI
jgi:hypothetical protein